MFFKPFSKSLIRSFIFSRPADNLIRFYVIPIYYLLSSLNPECVIFAGIYIKPIEK